MLDEINITTITYTANNNLGSHQQTEYEILNDLNNVIGIAQILPQLPAYSKNMYRTTKLIISGAKRLWVQYGNSQ